MSQTTLPRRLDKAWRRKYDAEYRARTKEHRKHQTREYRSRPEVKERLRRTVRAWYNKNKETVIARRRAERETIDGKIHQWKLGAKRRGIQWLLTPTAIKSLPLVCYYTGLSLTLKIGSPNTLSIDRLDSGRPYEEGNVVPCCSMINIMKQHYNKKDFIEMCKQVASHQPQ